MTCYYPMVASRSPFLTEKGKEKIKIHKINSVSIESWRGADWFLLPCGNCIGCRLDHAREWACRCVHEAQLHCQNCFITLTYNNKNLPMTNIENVQPRMTLNKRDLQLFFKRLRKKFPNIKFKYFACGEYGTKNFRPHYHACLFGIDFPDKEIIYFDKKSRFKNIYKTGIDHTLYTSKILSDTWGFGYVTIGEVTLESAGYVARYVTKKMKFKTKIEQLEYYGGRQPEFALMSRGGTKGKGLAYDWFKRYHTDVYPKDFFTINGHKFQPSRYYDSLLEVLNPILFKQIKKERRKKQLESKDDTSLELLGKDKYKLLQSKTLVRDL